ncbi:hypothetical protein B0T25DRAFT_522267 [Lasiosphaeria hispida]|uniref:Uncharacterized protein n=1 Tax=Lasiosphaeria hispida TaxID=260671 RepID=A0AAJ0H9P0_9PEZI|nr:hypothetical protein B0T25DRAFT_522267 [Lasiosphaeria hispida]
MLAISRFTVQVGTPKPEVRLARAINAFTLDLEKQDEAQFQILRRQSPPAAEGIINITEGLNRRLNVTSKPYGTRLVQILEAVQLVSRAGDIVVGGAQGMTASGVWACVRFCLKVSTQVVLFLPRC